MRTSTRWLTGFGIGVAALIIVTLVLIFTFGRQSEALLEANTPEGTVQRYLLAVRDKDYIRAYKYLDPSGSIFGTNGPRASFEFFKNSAQHTEDVTWKATIGLVTKVAGEENANVSVKVEGFRHQGLIGAPTTNNDITFILRRVEGSWLISNPQDLYWIY